MDGGIISLRYAKALHIYAAKHDATDRVYNDAKALTACFVQYPALHRVLDNLLLSPTQKAGVIDTCCKGMSPEFTTFINLVITRRREIFLNPMCLDYIELVRMSKNMLDISVTTPVALDPETRQLFKQQLGKMTGKTVTLHPHIDPSLLGGYILRWDTYRLDRSISTLLKNIEKRLIHDRQHKG